MGFGPKMLVAPPRPLGPEVGLVTSALRPEGEDLHWQNGILYEPENCSSGDLADPCDYSPITFPTNVGEVEFDAFVVRAGDKCSTFGTAENARDFADRATRLLERCQSKQLEAEFWTGAFAQAKGWPNRYLASPMSDVLSDGPTSVTDALACLEEGIGYYACDSVGFIHAQRYIVTQWVKNGLIDRIPADDVYPGRKGWLNITKLGTIVVAGNGYDGSGPDGQSAAEGSVWAYATSPVEVRLGPVRTVPGAAELVAAVNRGENDVEYVAQRIATATWDGCLHLAVEMAASPCGFAGAGS